MGRASTGWTATAPNTGRCTTAAASAGERAGRWPEAEADLTKALRLQPDQPDVLNYLGYSWIDKGMHLEQARKMIERAVELRPDDGAIVDSLGWALYRMGNFVEAVTVLEHAVELKGDDPTINEHLGDAYWRAGRKDEARYQWSARGPRPRAGPDRRPEATGRHRRAACRRARPVGRRDHPRRGPRQGQPVPPRRRPPCRRLPPARQPVIAFADSRRHLDAVPADGFRLTGAGPTAPLLPAGEENIVERAARRLAERAGLRPDAALTLT